LSATNILKLKPVKPAIVTNVAHDNDKKLSDKHVRIVDSRSSKKFLLHVKEINDNSAQ
jgi:hypothetical protein